MLIFAKKIVRLNLMLMKSTSHRIVNNYQQQIISNIKEDNKANYQQNVFENQIQTQQQQKLSITSLPKLLVQAQSFMDDLINQMSVGTDKIFAYGMDQNLFYLQLSVYYNNQNFKKAKVRFRRFLTHNKQRFAQLNAQGVTKENPNEQWRLLNAYRRNICILLLSYSSLENEDTKNVFLDSLFQLLSDTKVMKQKHQLQRMDDKKWCIEHNFLSNWQLTRIISNLQRVFSQQFEFENTAYLQKNYWKQITILQIILEHYIKRKDKIDIESFQFLIGMISHLKIFHAKFAELVLVKLQSKKEILNLSTNMLTVKYLADMQCFPYQFFVKEHRLWLKIIANYQLYNTSKIILLCHLLKIFGRQRIPHCQTYLDQMLQIIQKNLPAFNISQLIRMMVDYSKIKFALNPLFIAKTVTQVKKLFKEITSVDCARLIKAMVSMKHFDQQLIAMIRSHDFSQIGLDLKSLIPSIDNYYIAVLNQIDESDYSKRQQHVFDDQQLLLL